MTKRVGRGSFPVLVEHLTLQHKGESIAQLVHAELDEVNLAQFEQIGAVYLLVAKVSRILRQTDGT